MSVSALLALINVSKAILGKVIESGGFTSI